jgi:hypothetical protein
MTILNTYLNVKHSTRNLSDHQFDMIVPQLAKELENTSFLSVYTDEQLRTDWKNLQEWMASADTLSSTARVGLKLCEHFFPNFYDIKNNRGKSFSNLWVAENLEKILRWNRKCHSTPYMSEIKRGIYFCCGLTKNTMYRPQLMKLACSKYNVGSVLDPCAGWGGRMLGTVSYGAHYTAFEPNTETYSNLTKLIEFLDIGNKVTLICDDALNIKKYNLPKVDMVLTSPPYFDLEIYTDQPTQSIANTSSYTDWSTKFLREIIHLGIDHLNPGGVSCWNVGKVGKNDMVDDVVQYHIECNFRHIETISITSSKRQSNQSAHKNDKSLDNTNIFGN